MSAISEKITRILRQRQAYRHVFKPDGDLNVASKIVLADLHEFCKAGKSTVMYSMVSGNVDPIASAVAEGRREVWLRLIKFLNVSDEDMYKLIELEKEISDAT